MFFFQLNQTCVLFLAGIQHKKKSNIIRSYHGGYTASHPNCEVKHHWARSVLRWGTTRESRVSNVFCFTPHKFVFSEQDIARADSNHHSIKPQWIYRIPSELRSQALLGPISTAVGDYAGILGVECFFFFMEKSKRTRPIFFLKQFISHPFPAPAERTSHRLKKKRKTNRQTEAKSHAIVTTR